MTHGTHARPYHKRMTPKIPTTKKRWFFGVVDKKVYIYIYFWIFRFFSFWVPNSVKTFRNLIFIGVFVLSIILDVPDFLVSLRKASLFWSEGFSLFFCSIRNRVKKSHQSEHCVFTHLGMVKKTNVVPKFAVWRLVSFTQPQN